MGHYASEMYPRGYDVEMREEAARQAEQRKKEEARRRMRRAAEATLMKISGIELPQEEVKRRITAMLKRHSRITSAIPVPLTLHLEDEEDEWDMFGFLDESGFGKLNFGRDPFRERETFELSISKDGARATHMEVLLLDMSMDSKNSERELKPAEELFNRLISPIEEKMGIKPLGGNGEQVVFQNKP